MTTEIANAQGADVRAGPSAQPGVVQSAWPRGAVVAAWAIMLAGAGLRIVRFLQERSLWLDEASLAMSIVRRPFSGLVGTLDHEQGAPIGFLMAMKLGTRVLGEG